MSENIRKLQGYLAKQLDVRQNFLGVSLKHIAHQVGISEHQLKQYKSGESTLPSSTLYQIALALNVGIDYFFQDLPQAPSTIESNKKSRSQHTHTQPLNILLIDDNEADVYLTQKAFKNNSIPVGLRVLNDGTEAIPFLQHQIDPKTKTHVIVLNLNLPKIHGLTLLRSLKQHPTLSHIPVVILSGSINTRDIVTCYQKHAAGYMHKVFDFDHFKKNMDIFAHYWAETVVLPNRHAHDIDSTSHTKH